MRMKTAVYVLPLLAACLILAPHPARAAGRYPLILVDQFGRRVTLSREPRRIVSCSPGSTETLFALGLGTRIVGVTNWCNYPAAAAAVAKIGDITPLDVERVLALAPDLIAAEELNGQEAIETLGKLGATVLVLQPDSFAEILEAIALLGKATDHQAQSASLIKRLRDTLTQVGSRGDRIRKRGLKVFIMLGVDQFWTAGPGSFLDEAVTLAGGSNIAADLGKPWGQMSLELVLQRDPDVIITDTDPAGIYNSAVWEETAAVRKHQVFRKVGDEYYRPGPRLIESLQDLAELLEGCK